MDAGGREGDAAPTLRRWGVVEDEPVRGGVADAQALGQVMDGQPGFGRQRAEDAVEGRFVRPTRQIAQMRAEAPPIRFATGPTRLPNQAMVPR